MTLEAYNPDRFDHLSLRMLDLCARMRNLARQSREEDLPPLALHDRKALEWLDNLDDWLYKAEAEMTVAVHKLKGERHARKVRKSPPK